MKLNKILLALACCLTLASCDDDVDRSVVLSGDWDGYFGAYYSYEVRKGKIVEFDSKYSDINFTPQYDYATYGYGREIDFYEYGPYECQYFYFRWEIADGIIHIHYPADPALDVSLRDYELSNRILWGYFTGTGTEFRLKKYSTYYDWTPFTYYDYEHWHCFAYDDWYWDEDWYYSHYYSPALRGEVDDPSATAPVSVVRKEVAPEQADASRIVRFGNRNNEKKF